MLKLFNNFNLRRYNSFGVDVSAKYFLEYTSEKDLLEFMSDKQLLIKQNPILILGGGCNTLFSKNFDGIIFHSKIDCLNVIEEDENSILLKVGGGIVWDDFVEYAVLNDYKGIENLSLIPGSVSASAVQNIGAYGVEAKDCIESVESVDLKTNEKRILSNDECQFVYRGSIFKKEKQLIITFVNYRLKKNEYEFQLAYANLKEKLSHLSQLNVKAIRKIIIEIREGKLPDHTEIGNVGSFFKNPIVSKLKHDTLKSKFPNLVAYSHASGNMKLAAGWLIERCGWKGKTIGNVGVYEKQALVIINKGKATGAEIIDFANKIITSVEEEFGVRLEPEVVYV